MEHELKAVTTPADWRALHTIRRAVLFAPERYPGLDYNDNHPDDFRPNHTPFLLLADSRPIGVVRLDKLGELGTVRLVAIAAEAQGRGHGRVLEAMVCDAARRRGILLLRVNAAPDAVGFYEKTGWRRDLWDVTELTGIASDCVQMVKDI